MKKTTFMAACKEYFGFKDGQDLAGFMREIKELTPADRTYFTAMFPSVGYEIVSAV